MRVELTEPERVYILEVLEEAHKVLLHEIHHSDSQDYKERLRQTAGMNEALVRKLRVGIAV